MKKIFASVLVLAMLFALTACGASTPSAYEGKYVCVSAAIWGVSLSGDDLSDMYLEIKSGGKGVISVDDNGSTDIKWSEKDGKMTVTIEGTDTEATLGTDTITFEDFLGIGVKYVFAKEGSAAADPSLYIELSDDEKAMAGEWTSYAVADISGEDLSETYYEDGLKLVVGKDYTYKLYLGGDEVESGTWSSLGAYGFPEESEYSLNWSLLESGELEASVDFGDEETIIYTCAK